MKSSAELGAKKISFLSLSHSVKLGKLLSLAGSQFYYLENQDSNSYFTVFVHLCTHSSYKRLLGSCDVPGSVLGACSTARV